jgi:hypothetical protein
MVGSSDDDSSDDADDDDDDTNTLITKRKESSKQVAEYEESRRRALLQVSSALDNMGNKICLTNREMYLELIPSAPLGEPFANPMPQIRV